MEMSPEYFFPTPPSSSQGSLSPALVEDTVISVSTAFFPGVEHTPAAPDLILMSSDNVFFYVHSHRVLPASNNGFDSKWPPASVAGIGEAIPPVVALPEASPVINLMLHVVYNLWCSEYVASNEDVIQTVDALSKYGVSVRAHICPNTPLYDLILSRAPISPIEMYALAANHDLEELATAISSHLLSFDLSGLSDELVERMGAVYLRRLIFLHLGRSEALKRLLLPPSAYHLPTSDCGFKEQGELVSAWSHATAALCWNARPGK